MHCAAGEVNHLEYRAVQLPQCICFAAGHTQFKPTGARGALDLGQVDVAGSLVGLQAASL